MVLLLLATYGPRRSCYLTLPRSVGSCLSGLLPSLLLFEYLHVGQTLPCKVRLAMLREGVALLLRGPVACFSRTRRLLRSEGTIVNL